MGAQLYPARGTSTGSCRDKQLQTVIVQAYPDTMADQARARLKHPPQDEATGR